MFFLITMVVVGLALPFTGRWLYDAVREKSVKLWVLTGLAFVGNLVIFAYLLWLVWRVMNVTV